MTYPDVLPHDPPRQIAEDLFVVHGCVKPSAVVRFTRNMAVIRDGEALTLVNPVRMDEAGLAALEQLGRVEHVLRLGPLHGMDDPFYVDRYGAQFWSFTDGTTYTQPTIDCELSEDGALPFSQARLLAFRYMKETEGVILLEREAGNVLLTCDGIQSYAAPPHTPHTNWLTRLLMPFIGFPKKTLIGPVWIKLLVEDKAGIQTEFNRVLELEFESILAAHGSFLPRNAQAELRQAIQDRFG